LVRVYSSGKEITEPELLERHFAPKSSDTCEDEIRGEVVLSVIVDADGNPRNVSFLTPLGNDLDKLALVIVEHDRFKPGIHETAPVAVGISLKMSLDACSRDGNDGQKAFQLKSAPLQTVNHLSNSPKNVAFTEGTGAFQSTGESATKPETLDPRDTRPERIFVDEPMKPYVSNTASEFGTNVVSLVVDAQGMPRLAEIVRTLRADLDERAILAASHSRFKPAVRNGQPVAVKISIQCRFRLDGLDKKKHSS
jgi:TonB family protein